MKFSDSYLFGAAGSCIKVSTPLLEMAKSLLTEFSGERQKFQMPTSIKIQMFLDLKFHMYSLNYIHASMTKIIVFCMRIQHA